MNTAPVVTTNPADTTVNAGAAASFTAAASGNPPPTVQWQMSTDGGATFNPISGATSATYSFTATAAQNGYEYEAVFTNSVGGATTAAATLTVISVPIIGAWNSAVDSVWNSAANWSDSQGTGAPGFSGVAGDQATLNGVGVQVDLVAANPVIAALSFGGSAGNYTVESTGGGQLQMSNGGGTATIGVAAGNQTISAAVQLTGNTVIDAAATTTLDISGAIGGAGSLTVGDSSGTYTGTVVLGVANNYSGGTVVSSGTLAVAAAGALPAGQSLSIGPGGTFLFDPNVSLAPVSLGTAATATANPATASTVAGPMAAPVASVAAAQTKAHDAVLVAFEGKSAATAVAWSWLAGATDAQGPARRHAPSAVDQALRCWPEQKS